MVPSIHKTRGNIQYYVELSHLRPHTCLSSTGLSTRGCATSLDSSRSPSSNLYSRSRELPSDCAHSPQTISPGAGYLFRLTGGGGVYSSNKLARVIVSLCIRRCAFEVFGPRVLQLSTHAQPALLIAADVRKRTDTLFYAPVVYETNASCDRRSRSKHLRVPPVTAAVRPGFKQSKQSRRTAIFFQKLVGFVM